MRPPPAVYGDLNSDDDLDWETDAQASSGRNPFRWGKNKVRSHVDWLAGLRAAYFILVVGAWAVVLKPILMAISWLVEVKLLEVQPLMSIRPLEWLAASVSGALLVEGHEAASVLGVNLVFIALLLPLLTTACAQLLPLHILRERISRGWLRALISLNTMGLIYMLAFGRLGFFIAGVGLGAVLLWVFEVRRRQGTTRRAFFLTLGVHAFANAAVVLVLVLAGAL